MHVGSNNTYIDIKLLFNEKIFNVQVYWSKRLTRVSWPWSYNEVSEIAIEMQEVFTQSYEYFKKKRAKKKKYSSKTDINAPAAFLDVMSETTGVIKLIPRFSAQAKTGHTSAGISIDDTVNTSFAPYASETGITIWNDSIAYNFEKWLEYEGYSQRTAKNYRLSVSAVYRLFYKEAQYAMYEASSSEEAIKKWISDLNSLKSFIDRNNERHRQDSGALAALVKFRSITSINGVQNINEVKNPVINKQSYATSTGVVIWNDEIGKYFQKWLINEGYSQGTARNYRFAVGKLYRDYGDLAQQAINSSTYVDEAVQLWISTLKRNQDFQDYNNARYRRDSTALSAFEKYILVSSPSHLGKHKQQIVNKKNKNRTINQASGMTIKDAIIVVLSTSGLRMTSNEIYERITNQNLFIFKAKNPANIVRYTLDFYSENTNFARHSEKPVFRFSYNSTGKRVYSLIHENAFYTLEKRKSSNDQTFDIAQLSTSSIQEKALEILSNLSQSLINKKALPYITAYEIGTSKDVSLLRKLCPTGATIAEIPSLVGNIKDLEESKTIVIHLLNFAEWLSYDVETIKQGILKRGAKVIEQTRYALRLRLSGKTLQEVSSVIGVTRERVRQIEQNALQKFCERYSGQEYELLSLVAAIHEGGTAVSFQMVEDNFGAEFTQLFWAVLKHKNFETKSNQYYYYNDDLDVFEARIDDLSDIDALVEDIIDIDSLRDEGLAYEFN